MHQHLLLSRSSWLDNESGRTKGDGPLRLGHKVNWLEIEGGSLAFGARQALDDVDLAVGPGVTALLGRNGAGKTTLCRVCSGDLDLDKGQVRLGGVPSPRADLAKLGWLPQSLLFPGSMRVIEAVRYAAWLKGATVEVAYDRADYWLDRVDLGDRRDARCRELSGGMERRLGLAAALAGDPVGLILDEPSSGLDPLQRGHLHDLVRQLSADRGVVLSTHLLEDVASVADHVVVLELGRIVFTGDVEELGGGSRGADALRAGLVRVLQEAA